MKLPISAIARFAFNRIVLPAIGKAIADGKNPLDQQTAKRAIEQAVRREAERQIGKRIHTR